MMKKNLFFLLMAVWLLQSFPVQAFFPLPPFKEDSGKSSKKTLTTVQTRAQEVAKKIQESSFVQQSITYGKGAKEAYEFSQKAMAAYQEQDFGKMGSLLGDVNKAYKKKKEAKEKAALEINAKSKVNEAKIAELRENNNLLRKEIIDNPNKKKKNEKKIKKNEEKIAKLTKESQEAADKINADLASQLGKIDLDISGLRDSAASLLDSFKTIGADYDATSELKETAASLMPADDVESTARLIEAYRKAYIANYYTMLAKVIARSSLLKSQIEEDNEKALKNYEALGVLEGQTPAITTLVKMKAQNAQALLNYTELMLLRLQLDMAYDLAHNNFARVSLIKTVEDFSFDNYRMVKAEPETTKVKEYKFGGGNVERTFEPDLEDDTRLVVIEAVQDIKKTAEEFKKNSTKAQVKTGGATK